MGIFFNRKKDLNNKKVLEKKPVENISNNAYVLKNFKLRLPKMGSSIVINKKECIKCYSVFYIDSDKDYSFDLKWADDLYKREAKFTPDHGRITLSYDIFPNGLKNVDLKIIISDYDGDCDTIRLGSFENWRKYLEEQFYMPDETKMLISKIFDAINFTNDVNFVRRFVSDHEEFERMLKHINYSEVNDKTKPNLARTIDQTSVNKALLEAKKNELLSANAKTPRKNTTVQNNFENDPLGEYIANQAKQKIK